MTHRTVKRADSLRTHPARDGTRPKSPRPRKTQPHAAGALSTFGHRGHSRRSAGKEGQADRPSRGVGPQTPCAGGSAPLPARTPAQQCRWPCAHEAPEQPLLGWVSRKAL